MTGIKLSGVLAANDMFQEFQYYRNTTNQQIITRPATGRTFSSTQTYSLPGSMIIPADDPANGTTDPLSPTIPIVSDHELGAVKITVDPGQIVPDTPTANQFGYVTTSEIPVWPDLSVIYSDPEISPYGIQYVESVPELVRYRNSFLYDFNNNQFVYLNYGVPTVLNTNAYVSWYTQGSQVAMDEYFRSSLDVGGVIPINVYNTGVGELLLNNAYKDYYGARRNPIILDSTIYLGNYTKGNSGFINGYIYVRQGFGTFFGCSRIFCNGVDYSYQYWVPPSGGSGGGGGGGGNDGYYATGYDFYYNLWQPSTMYDSRSGFIAAIDTGSIGLFSNGGKTTSIRVQTQIIDVSGKNNDGSPTKYQLRVNVNDSTNVTGHAFITAGDTSGTTTLRDWIDITLFQ